MTGLKAFIRESNLIEGIRREPTEPEMAAARTFLGLPAMTDTDLHDLQAVFAPHHPLRRHAGMDVQVGDYVAPSGGQQIEDSIRDLVARANRGGDPWKVHVAFEMLHPYLDGNGRTGRMLWAWQMQEIGRHPFALPFLHRFYYQTLEGLGGH